MAVKDSANVTIADGQDARNAVQYLKDENRDDDNIGVNTKTKEVTVEKTNDNFDMVSVDGAKPVKKDEKGKTVAEYKKQGYWIGNAPEGVGDGSFWGAMIWLGGEKVGSWIWDGVTGMFAKSAANEGVTVIGEGMARVEAAAAKIPGSVILNTMPKFTGTAEQITSQMMQYNRQWILNQLRSGRTILDIGRDATRVNPSIFYQMEQNMIKNYKLLHP